MRAILYIYKDDGTELRVFGNDDGVNGIDAYHPVDDEAEFKNQDLVVKYVENILDVVKEG